MNWGELITLEYGKPVKDKESTDGKVPVYGTNGQIGTSHLPAQCKHPSFILGRKGAYRGVHYSDCPFSVIDTAFYAEPLTDRIDLKWAYYKFLTYDINGMDSGSAIPSTDRYQIYSIEVEVPPLEKQRKIVAVLDCIDRKININQKLQVCKDLLHGFDFSGFIGGSPLMMAKLVTGGVNFVLDAKAPKRKDLFLREALLLKQSHSLCSSMTTEQERHEAAYMEAVRSTVVKITYGGSGGKTLSLKEINAQINELLKASIQSQGVISLFDSKKADENISLFDPAVLDEISKMKEKNIAVEILKKLMAEQVSLYKRTNVVQSQKFSEKITQLMNSYYNTSCLFDISCFRVKKTSSRSKL